MAVRLPTNLPVLDFTNISNRKPGTSSRLSTCRLVRAALQKHGRFVVSEDKISPKFKEDVYTATAKVATQPPSNVPLLDFNNIADLKPGTSSWLSACRDVRDALEEYACFVVSYDKVSPELKKDVFHAMKELFDLPTEKKQEYNLVKPGLSGYLQTPVNPLFEAMNILDTRNEEKVEDFVNFMLPSANEQLSKNLDYYRSQAQELQEMIMRMLFESYGIEKYFGSHKESTVYLLRLNHYRLPQMNEKKPDTVLRHHTDMTFLTILCSSPSQGLEIQGKDGNWIRLDCPPSSVVVITGDAMQAWSNGRIRSCVHRVSTNSTEERYTIGIFFMHKGTVAAPKELVDEEHPLLYKPFDHFDFLSYSLSEIPDVVCAKKIEAYCERF